MAQVKTTKIVKQYRDKKTGQTKSLEINYAKVADRLKEFRQDNPNGLIETTPTIDSDNGYIMFKTRILVDKGREDSAESTGHALAKIDGTDKQFERLETISVGRALALLGYSVGGEIASSEEMAEFHDFKKQKVNDAIDALRMAKTIDELKATFMGLGNLIADSKVVKAKDQRKEELINESLKPTTK